jgi:hypothetical protein
VEVGSSDLDDFRGKLEVVFDARSRADRQGPFEVTVSGDLANQQSCYEALAAAGATRIVVDPRAHLGARLDPTDAIQWAREFANSFIVGRAAA